MTDETNPPITETPLDSDSNVCEVIQEEPKIFPAPKFPMPPALPQRRTDYSSQRYVKDEEISGQVVRLARIGLSKNAVAIACRLTLEQLNRHYLDDYGKGQAGMQEVVAWGLMEQAEAGNAQVLMYLGKSKLGWTEANVVEHVGEIRAVVSAKPLTREEFEQKYLNRGESDE